jgi:hypothetical protein
MSPVAGPNSIGSPGSPADEVVVEDSAVVVVITAPVVEVVGSGRVVDVVEVVVDVEEVVVAASSGTPQATRAIESVIAAATGECRLE